MLTFGEYTHEFLDASARWFADTEIRELINAPIVTDQQREAFFNSLPTRTDYKIWGISYDGVPIGACGLKHITENDAESWCYIGEKEFWGKGLGSTIADFWIGMARQINLSRIYIRVNTLNKRSIKLHLKCGYVRVESDVDGLDKMMLEL